MRRAVCTRRLKSTFCRVLIAGIFVLVAVVSAQTKNPVGSVFHTDPRSRPQRQAANVSSARVESPEVDVQTSTQRALPVIGTPVLNRPDLLLSMLRSLDYPVSTLVVVHNLDSNEDTNAEVERVLQSLERNASSLVNHGYIDNIIIVRNEDNLGFSAGVNQILSSVPESPFWLVVNNDVEFLPGSLREMAERMFDSSSSHKTACVWAMVGEPVGPFSTFIITRRAVRMVGIWDENFWPAYGEDCDYEARLVRAECPMIFESNTSRLARHVGSAAWRTTGRASSLSSLVARGNNNFDYIESKWGTNVCGARKVSPPYIDIAGYLTPFNDSRAPLSRWSVDATRRANRGGPQRCAFRSSEEFYDTADVPAT